MTENFKNFKFKNLHLKKNLIWMNLNLIQYCARIWDTDFPQKLPVVPYTCALFLIGADSIFWRKIYFV